MSVTVDLGGVAGERLVDGVVDDLVDHVVQAGAVVGVADIHARPLAHGVEALQDLDRFRIVIGRSWSLLAGRFSHGQDFRIALEKARGIEVWCDTKMGGRTGPNDWR